MFKAWPDISGQANMHHHCPNKSRHSFFYVLVYVILMKISVVVEFCVLTLQPTFLCFVAIMSNDGCRSAPPIIILFNQKIF
jgi:hypothetical protein